MPDDFQPLNEREKALLEKLFGSPLNFPASFKSWVTNWVEISEPRISPSSLGSAIGVNKLETGSNGSILKTAAGVPSWTSVGGNGALLYNTGSDLAWTDAPADGELPFAIGSVPTWQHPVINHTDFEANVNITATTEATAQDVVSSGAITYQAKPILIEFFCIRITPLSGGLFILLKDGSTVIGRIGSFDRSGGGPVGPAYMAHRLTPTAASHTYKIAAHNDAAGTSVLFAGAGGAGLNLPGFIRITRDL